MTNALNGMAHFDAVSGGSGQRTCGTCRRRYPSGTRFCPADGHALRDAVPLDNLVGWLIADRYQVERRLAVGGMGVVYLARQVLMSRPCALKVLRPEFLDDAAALGRFTRGAQNAARIIHPNVATVYDFGEVEGESMYLAMEYVVGKSLGEVLRDEGHLPLARTIGIVAQVAAALKAAHDLGIVHRDLKPGNIMLVRADAGEVVKVVDFGIARAVREESQQLTNAKTLVGTPAYMSPEQVNGDPVDGRSDLYSLALLTFEMLTGKRPLSSELAEIALRLVQRPRSLREIRPEVPWPAALQDVFDRALAVNPSDRQPNVSQFGREFIAACRGWRPDAVAEAVDALSALGMSVSLARPTGPGPAVATPPTTPAVRQAPAQRRSWRVVLMAGTAAVVLIAAALVALFGFSD